MKKNVPTFRKLNTQNIIQRFCGNRKYKNKCVFPLTFSMMFPDDHLRLLPLAYSLLINMASSLAYSPIMESYCLRIYTTGKGLGRCCLKSPLHPLVLKPDIFGGISCGMHSKEHPIWEAEDLSRLESRSQTLGKLSDLTFQSFCPHSFL